MLNVYKTIILAKKVAMPWAICLHRRLLRLLHHTVCNELFRQGRNGRFPGMLVQKAFICICPSKQSILVTSGMTF